MNISCIDVAFIQFSDLFPKMTVLVHRKQDIFLGSDDGTLTGHTLDKSRPCADEVIIV